MITEQPQASLPNLFSLPPLVGMPPRQKSITQTHSPLIRKFAGIKSHSVHQNPTPTVDQELRNLHTAIQNLSITLHNRMGFHEVQLLEIMKQQISKIMEEAKQVVKVYNDMIKEKNYSQDLWETRNEVQYFKFEAFKLFEENKVLRKQIIDLKREVQGLKFNQDCQNGALRKMAKKLAKEKAIRTYSIDLKQNKNNLQTPANQESCQNFHQHRRHQSLYSQLQKKSYKINLCQLTPKNVKSYVEGNFDNTTKIKQMKSDKYEIDVRTMQKTGGYSQKINIINKSSRDKKLKLFKQRKNFNNLSVQLSVKTSQMSSKQFGN